MIRKMSASMTMENNESFRVSRRQDQLEWR